MYRIREVALSALALGMVPATFGQTNLSVQSRPPQPVRPAMTTVREIDRAVAGDPQPPPRSKVTWDGPGLEIEASNSSLNQILRQIAAHTGAKLEGLSRDQRIFGSYGPGPASEVLLKLLEGSGYNLVIVGGRDAEPLLGITLSARLPAGTQASVNPLNRMDRAKADTAEPEPEPEDTASSSRPEPAQNPFSNGNAGLPKDPEEFMQAILQRQQKIDEQQDGQNNPQ